jgi:hypothetical protein
MLVNKYILASLNLIMLLVGACMAFDWNSLVSPHEAGVIVSVLATIKLVLSALLPSPGQPYVKTTGMPVVTHT